MEQLRLGTPNCFNVAKVTKEEHRALRALRTGEATPGQQGMALALITNKISRTHDVLFVPGAADESAFLAGRAFVGSQVLKLLNIPVGKLEETQNE